jgi:hypothetical protein
MIPGVTDWNGQKIFILHSSKLSFKQYAINLHGCKHPKENSRRTGPE